MSKHEEISCERCHAVFECRANSSFRCQCNTVTLSLNEMQYISERFEACLCASCLAALKEEYNQN